jgi:hypothetical protein
VTGQQRRLYQAALRIGRSFGTGGRTWVPVVPSGNGATLTVGAAIGLLIVENNLVRSAGALPGPAIYSAPWWGIGVDEVVAETVIVSSADGRAFVVTGAPDTSQGFCLTPLALSANPLLMAPLRRTGQGLQTGLRQGF